MIVALMKSILHNYISGVSCIFAVFSVGMATFFKDRTLEDYQGKSYLETESDRDLVEKTLSEIRKKGKPGSEKVRLSNGNEIEVFIK